MGEKKWEHSLEKSEGLPQVGKAAPLIVKEDSSGAGIPPKDIH